MLLKHVAGALYFCFRRGLRIGVDVLVVRVPERQVMKIFQSRKA